MSGRYPRARRSFPNEPMVIVRGPVVQAQLLETMLLLTINHQSLIATKANRIVRAAQGRAVMEFGSRRAQGLRRRHRRRSGCLYWRAAAGTACTMSDQLYGVPAVGTMAHAWVQMFDTRIRGIRDLLRDTIRRTLSCSSTPIIP